MEADVYETEFGVFGGWRRSDRLRNVIIHLARDSTRWQWDRSDRFHPEFLTVFGDSCAENTMHVVR